MSCGCCDCLSGAGAHPAIFNRPGLGAVRYRVGTHATFLDAMIRRLTVPVDGKTPYSLHRLTTRESDDPAIALLDAWAMVGDVLTFYQERIANESYLATATERRSMLELGRLVGYALKPGVSASVYLAYTLDDGAKTIIPAGTKAQSVPGANETPQMFETSVDTEARAAWNALRPRMRKPQSITLDNVLTIESVWIDGTTTRIEKREPVFFVFEADMVRRPPDYVDVDDVEHVSSSKSEVHAIRRVREVLVDDAGKRTRIVLEPVRPYYTKLYEEVLSTWRSIEHPPIDPDPTQCAPVFDPPAADPIPKSLDVVEAPPAKTSRKKKKNLEEPPAFNAQTVTLDVDKLLRNILLGLPRLALIRVHEGGHGYTKITELLKALDVDPEVVTGTGGPESLEQLLEPLIRARGIAPASQWQFNRSLHDSVNSGSDLIPRVLGEFFPQAGASLYTAFSNLATGNVPYDELRSVHILRRQTRVFGYNAPPVLFEDRVKPTNPELPAPAFVAEEPDVLHAATPEESVAAGGYVVIVHSCGAIARKVLEAQVKPRSAYFVSGDSTRLALNAKWWRPALKDQFPNDPVDRLVYNLGIIRDTTVFLANEEVVLAQQTLDRPIGRKVAKGEQTNESPMRIELDGVVEGLTPGRSVIVTGPRADLSGTSGVVSAEVAMIANVELQLDSGAGGTPFSILELAPKGLAYEYERATVKILGNIVKADHGDTRHQILGGGDASKSLQTFTLNQAPLTFVSAPTVDGVASTLVVRVNDVKWHETDTFAGAGPSDRLFVTKTTDEGKVSIAFGTGREGARLPTGTDNVRATYRTGIGRGGNVRAGQITNAISRPLGVRDVINPIDAAGGADPQSRDSARRTIPISVQALGRIVSVRDYADFARTFAGIAKASAAVLSDGRRRTIVLSIGGEDDIDIPEDSDLYRNLTESLRRYGDPYQPFVVRMREKRIIAGAARVRVHPDYLWTNVAPQIRATLLETFSFERRDFGQCVFPAEVVATIQRVPGVSWVDLDVLGSIRMANLVKFDRALNTRAPRLPKLMNVHAIVPKPARRNRLGLHPAQLTYLPPSLADLFILTEIPA
jgi:hypothetical protein